MDVLFILYYYHSNIIKLLRLEEAWQDRHTLHISILFIYILLLRISSGSLLFSFHFNFKNLAFYFYLLLDK